MHHIKRIFIEQEAGFDEAARHLQRELQTFLGITGLTGLRLIRRYDLAVSEAEWDILQQYLFTPTKSEKVYLEELPAAPGEQILTKEYLPGQFLPALAGMQQAMQLLLRRDEPLVATAQILLLAGDLTLVDRQKIQAYWLNPLEARAAVPDKPAALEDLAPEPQAVKVLTGFTGQAAEELAAFHQRQGLAMSLDDLTYCQTYFREEEQRDPTITELKIIDTYWSDHCRHKTFFTPITAVEVEESPYNQPVAAAYQAYLKTRESLYLGQQRDLCLMDLALAGMRELRQKGLLDDLDLSEEINACSIKVTVEVDGEPENWLVMFKNETHNHPTEIEPFGGAATCLGGAIRDPLSGRSYIYQAMRVSGSADPRTPYQETLPGKLPQRQITTEAAQGYSFYGNQIGIPAGQVAEIYHPGYLAKRMECGAVIAAAPQAHVQRLTPEPGDVILLVGGKTGRDGCGGATGSSKEDTGERQIARGSEVPKGNPAEERKLLRLFRNPKAAPLIKKCNDFGAGGVSVAIGELADGVTVDLDRVPTAYPGLDGTELAIAESQERMAVVIAPQHAPTFIQLAEEENLQAIAVAGVTPEKRVKMYWRSQLIVDLAREFLDSGGIKDAAAVTVAAPRADIESWRTMTAARRLPNLKKAWLANLQDLNVASQQDLAALFDSTAGGGTVVLPFGGAQLATPAEGMVAKIPLLKGETTTATTMNFGYNPHIATWSPFHGGLYAVVEAVAKTVALGGDHRRIRLTMQEYFEKLEDSPEKWGKPFGALLGAYWGQKQFQIPAIGGKDSMSGTWQEINVPPTLIAFAVNTVHTEQVVTAEFKGTGNPIVLVAPQVDAAGLPDFNDLNEKYSHIHALICKGKVLAAATIKTGGLAATVSQMAFGNRIGAHLEAELEATALFQLNYGALVLEIPADIDLQEAFGTLDYLLIGTTQGEPLIRYGDAAVTLDEAYAAWRSPLKEVFGKVDTEEAKRPLWRDYPVYKARKEFRLSLAYPKPTVLIPVFPGTNGEYDGQAAFTGAGGQVEIYVFRNQNQAALAASLKKLAQKIANAQILFLPGGFSNWDEPAGAAKYLAAVLRQPAVAEAICTLLAKNGLILGIGNGFQALLRTGLLPYGEIRQPMAAGPYMTANSGGGHVSQYVRTKLVSVLSPWVSGGQVGDEHLLPLSCTAGRLVLNEQTATDLFRQGQVATQYVNPAGQPAAGAPFNPTGSFHAIEGLTSPDGRIFGKMAHSERWGAQVALNLPGNKDQELFKAGVAYFR